jgi:hypothetical protein
MAKMLTFDQQSTNKIAFPALRDELASIEGGSKVLIDSAGKTINLLYEIWQINQEEKSRLFVGMPLHRQPNFHL